MRISAFTQIIVTVAVTAWVFYPAGQGGGDDPGF